MVAVSIVVMLTIITIATAVPAFTKTRISSGSQRIWPSNEPSPRVIRVAERYLAKAIRTVEDCSPLTFRPQLATIVEEPFAGFRLHSSKG
jgi:hypothetical protein